MMKHDAIKADLVNTLRFFPDDCLRHVLDHSDRLIRGRYEDGKGGKCLCALLSERLPEDQRIHSRETLTTFFTGGHGANYRERPEYQSPRWLVRAWDGHAASIPDSRYGEIERLEVDIVLDTIRQELAAREVPHMAYNNESISSSSAFLGRKRSSVSNPSKLSPRVVMPESFTETDCTEESSTPSSRS